MAGVIVGIADGVVVWVYMERLEKGRREARRRAAKLGKGSRKVEVEGEGDDGVGNEEQLFKEKEVGNDRMEKNISPEKREIRLRRRALRDGIGRDKT